jgi:colanic acid/amylovoran biosynthesis protein
MRVLLDTGDYRCLNLGDVAMLQVAVRRLSALLPGASIEVLTEDEEALAKHCPGAVAVPCRGRTLWFSERGLLGGLHRHLPAAVSNSLVRAKKQIRSRWPAGLRRATRWRLGRHNPDSRQLDTFFDAFLGADLVAVSGAGGITDHARSWAIPVLNLLESASDRGVPAALLGHGLGPLRDEQLLGRAREVLPRLALVALREGRLGPEILRTLGVDPSRVVVTGDDAVELAYEARPGRFGDGIGVNVRVSRSAGVGPDMLEKLRPLIQAFARSRGASLVPLPISFNKRQPAPAGDGTRSETSPPDLTDSRSIRDLLLGYDDASDGGESIRTTSAVIEQVGRCRMVVTGAYHAAVFALAQGNPVVCLACSAYFAEKLLGLANQFGRGCEVVSLDDTELESRLSDAMCRAWDIADEVRLGLLEAARRQIETGHCAYRRFAEDALGRRDSVPRAGARRG